MSELDHGGVPASAVPILLSYGRHAPDDPPPLDPSHSLDTVERDTRHYRHDGWTPGLRASFLETLATSGVVTDACAKVLRSSQAAYGLRNRDPLFAAGWDAALSLARARLADEVFHRAVHGTVDQIWKNGEIVAERHRHDNRLAIAVLNRLDSRCDRAERIGAPTERLTAQWDFYLAALAEDRVADAQALLDPPPAPATHAKIGEGHDAALLHQLHQLRAGRALDEPAGCNPDDGAAPHFATDDDEDGARIWIEHRTWRTNFPPPDDFNGDEEGCYGDDDYNRQCTPEEWELLDRRYPDAFTDDDATDLADDEATREAFFATLASDVAPADPEPLSLAASPNCAHPEPVEGSVEDELPTPALRPAEGERTSAEESAPSAPDTS